MDKELLMTDFYKQFFFQKCLKGFALRSGPEVKKAGEWRSVWISCDDSQFDLHWDFLRQRILLEIVREEMWKSDLEELR